MSTPMIERLSPNHTERTKGIRLIVLHCDGSPKESATLSWTSSPKSQVSYHVLIARDGTCYRVAQDAWRAWAVGEAEWHGKKDVNSISLSLAWSNLNDGKESLTEAQIMAAKQVILAWRNAFPGIEEVTTHKIVARPPGRKHDPEAAPNFRLETFA